MAKTAFVMSALLALLGAVLTAAGIFARVMLPKIGYLVFSASGPGSYSPGNYAVDLGGYYTLTGACLAAGVVLCAAFYRAGRKEPRA
ncbi:MAG TPA: hypothetical protein PK636_09420 [bacterium]|nr:hypothetical protein [bacterium]HPJ72892.1 hypothetical protein [bacterium]HPQ67193.1 hypothetical protein [bacterium]